jgi:hypothetical protein
MSSRYPPFKAHIHSWDVNGFPCPKSIVEATTMLHSKAAAPTGRAATAPKPVTGLKKDKSGGENLKCTGTMPDPGTPYSSFFVSYLSAAAPLSADEDAPQSRTTSS